MNVVGNDVTRVPRVEDVFRDQAINPHLRSEASLSRIKLHAINAIGVEHSSQPVAVPVGCLRVGEVDVAGKGSVVIPP